MPECIAIHTDARGVATLTLARAAKRNALSAQMLDELTAAARDLGNDTNVRVVVLAAEGPVFCAGGDLDWMRAQMTAADAERRREARRLSDMLGALDALPKPLFARVHGDAFGGGVGLMTVCDAVVASAGARFALTETRLGLVPATIGPYVARRLGPATRQLFFTPRLIDATRAQQIGLVAEISEEAGLDAALEGWIAPALTAAPAAVSRAKALARKLTGAVDQTAVEAALDCLVETWAHPEADAGVRAFFERSAPPWKN